MFKKMKDDFMTTHPEYKINNIGVDLDFILEDDTEDFSGMCSQISTSTQKQLVALSQDVGCQDIMDLQNNTQVKKSKRKKPEMIYKENNTILRQTCNIIDTDPDMCEDFHEEFLKLSKKYIAKMNKKHARTEHDSHVVSSHIISDHRSVSRRYKTTDLCKK